MIDTKFFLNNFETGENIKLMNVSNLSQILQKLFDISFIKIGATKLKLWARETKFAFLTWQTYAIKVTNAVLNYPVAAGKVTPALSRRTQLAEGVLADRFCSENGAIYLPC